MPKQLETGDILQLSNSKRMVYLGDGIAKMELFYPLHSEWKPAEYTKTMPLTEKQISFWLSKK
jgi:hypothetical protein